ncbi:lysophospholipid acyltransferase family protein [Pedobacter antarcticus]|uniref:lysophospholipid acyltransferase family protein n=1 Tax=Pedobacter antarcticus TaxID=34086 RepID=UPI000891E2E3|nr:lysophospholipid acyltransferase family protein [Pedobacter antarcticus]SDL56764.1 KDO2-lipid IV(A) lauroyltransferase [Pedobacter antarcticus]
MTTKHHGLNFIYCLIFPPIYLLGMLPYLIVNALVGRPLFFLSYTIFRYRYSVVLQNLSRALPLKSYLEIELLAKEFYLHLASMIVEIIRLFSISSHQQLKQVKLINPEVLEEYFKGGRNVIAVLGHYGNWECLNVLPLLLPFQVNAIYKPLSNPVMAKLVTRVRCRYGMQLIPAKHALRHLLRQTRQPQFSLFIADQFPGKQAKCQVDFLHQPTLMFNGAEKLARATNAVVVYLDMIPQDRCCWKISLSLITDTASTTTENLITHTFSSKLEQTIERHPAYWLWSHRRWKA